MTKKIQVEETMKQYLSLKIELDKDKSILDQKTKELEYLYQHIMEEQQRLDTERNNFEEEKEHFQDMREEIDRLRHDNQRLTQDNLKLASKNNILKDKFESLKRSTQQQTPCEQYRGLASTNNTKSKQTLDAMQVNTDIEYSSRNGNTSPQIEYLDTNTDINERYYRVQNHPTGEFDQDNYNVGSAFDNPQMNQNEDYKQSMVRVHNYPNNQNNVYGDTGYMSDEPEEMHNYQQYNVNSRVKDFSLGQNQFLYEKQQQQEQFNRNRQQNMPNFRNQNMGNYYEINPKSQITFMNIPQNNHMIGMVNNRHQDMNMDNQIVSLLKFSFLFYTAVHPEPNDTNRYGIFKAPCPEPNHRILNRQRAPARCIHAHDHNLRQLNQQVPRAWHEPALLKLQ